MAEMEPNKLAELVDLNPDTLEIWIKEAEQRIIPYVYKKQFGSILRNEVLKKPIKNLSNLIFAQVKSEMLAIWLAIENKVILHPETVRYKCFVNYKSDCLWMKPFLKNGKIDDIVVKNNNIDCKFDSDGIFSHCFKSENVTKDIHQLSMTTTLFDNKHKSYLYHKNNNSLIEQYSSDSKHIFCSLILRGDEIDNSPMKRKPGRINDFFYGTIDPKDKLKTLQKVVHSLLHVALSIDDKPCMVIALENKLDEKSNVIEWWSNDDNVKKFYTKNDTDLVINILKGDETLKLINLINRLGY
ncbi:MAG: hypothetical protein C4531_06380 [Desulfurivibrio sp.]|nr:MAG: hypothetical protein C4531_06380 [Desulfurivibrio sp.]